MQQRSCAVSILGHQRQAARELLLVQGSIEVQEKCYQSVYSALLVAHGVVFGVSGAACGPGEHVRQIQAETGLTLPPVLQSDNDINRAACKSTCIFQSSRSSCCYHTLLMRAGGLSAKAAVHLSSGACRLPWPSGASGT